MDGLTALHMAVAFDGGEEAGLELAKLLLQHGAEPNQPGGRNSSRDWLYY